MTDLFGLFVTLKEDKEPSSQFGSPPPEGISLPKESGALVFSTMSKRKQKQRVIGEEFYEGGQPHSKRIFWKSPHDLDSSSGLMVIIGLWRRTLSFSKAKGTIASKAFNYQFF